jgi:coenzyme F420 hydrogenase subunit beta
MENGIQFPKRTDIYLGEFINAYIAYSNDNFIRQNASSGGVVTQLVSKLFDNKEIDGALLTRMKKEEPWLAEPYLAVTAKDIFDSMESKYQPVYVPSLIKSTKAGKKYVIVDKHCGLLSLDKTFEDQQIDSRPAIAFKFGIFCGSVMDMEGTDFLLHKLGVRKSRVRQLRYRWSNWPGGFYVEEEGGGNHFLPKEDYSLLAFLCSSKACLFCQDQTNESADISFGDAWGQDGSKGGFTVVITRTEKGERLMRRATEEGWITSREIDYTEVRKTHYFLCRYKKLGGKLRANYASRKPLLSNIDARLLPVKKQEIFSQLMYFHIFYTYRCFFLKVFRILPLGFFRFLSKNMRNKYIYENR